MKPLKYISLFIILFMVNACKKNNPLTKPVKFTSTTYKNISPYSALGLPDNLLKDTISSAMLSFMNGILIKGENLTIPHPELFTSTASANITITQPSNVFITFLSGNAAYSNSICFYTYPTNQPPTSAQDIKLITYVFPNAGHLSPLNPGDKMNIGSFNVGTTIGFVIMQNAWDTTTHTLNNNVVHFLSTDTLNPEVNPNLKRHAVLINYAPENKNIISFEDQDRSQSSCDNDFDDVTFYTTVTP